MSAAGWDIYAKELFQYGHGYPLWGPEPDMTYGEVRLGDVGYLREGRFCFLFNCLPHLEEESDRASRHSRGYPNGFKPLILPPNTLPQELPDAIAQPRINTQNVVAEAFSASVTAGQGGVCATGGVRYRCVKASGALLLLNNPAHKRRLNCDVLIKRYMIEHIDDWFQFARHTLYIDLEITDMIFVSGMTKTTISAAAAFQGGGSQCGLVLSGGNLVLDVAPSVQVSRTQVTEPVTHYRSGPRERVADWDNPWAVTSSPSDQCIFLNFYKMKPRRRFLGMRVEGAAGPGHSPHGFPDSYDDKAYKTISAQIPSSLTTEAFDVGAPEPERFDPVGEVLDYILLHSDADMACASDEDFIQCMAKVQSSTSPGQPTTQLNTEVHGQTRS
ncbi:hypothetical protein C8Q76DRAFT_796550 [Earliella scabrosa]|nr:hypothetical protein C8Q76DRAFT_796550 [Earliella scabrosa]